MCEPWYSDGDVLHLSLPPIDICFVCVIDPFLSCLFDFVLYLPCGRLGFISRGDLLNVGHDTIHGKCFSSFIGRALGSIMARLVTFETGDRRRVACLSSVVLWGRV